MGLSRKTAAERFSYHWFAPWNPDTDTFDERLGSLLRGKLFRTDRFTTIYHRPTRRSYVRMLTSEFPESGVVRKKDTEEVLLLSGSLKSDSDNSGVVYDRLRMSHLVTEPSGGLGTFVDVAPAGTGEDLGPVVLTEGANTYIDLELHSTQNIEESVDAVVPQFLITHSANISPLQGDMIRFGTRNFIILNPYVDGGFHLARVRELDSAYVTMSYNRRSGSSTYNPTTGLTTVATSPLLFSGIVGKTVRTNEEMYPTRMYVYVYKRHVGFTFELANEVSIGGTAYYVQSIKDRREEAQWLLELGR